MNDNEIRTRLLDALPVSVKHQLISALVLALLGTSLIGGTGIFRSGKFTDVDAARMEAGIRGDFNQQLAELRHQVEQNRRDIVEINLKLASLPPPAWQDRIRKLEQHMYSGHD